MADDDREAIGPATPATDLLEERGLDDDAALLRAAPAKADLLGRAVDLLERELLQWLRGWTIEAPPSWSRVMGNGRGGPLLALVAEARGETPEAALERLRLRNPVSAGYRLGPPLDVDSLRPLDVEALRRNVDAMLREHMARPDPPPLP